MVNIDVRLRLPETQTEQICAQRLHGAGGREAVAVLDSKPVETILTSATLGYVSALCLLCLYKQEFPWLHEPTNWRHVTQEV